MRLFTFLGTGTSTGVPVLGCACATCRSSDARNHRYRCAALISTPQGRILIDTPPELRLQLLRAGIGYVHAVLLTHYHADHLFGLDDVRLFPRYLGGPVPVYCNRETEQVLRQSFAYAFAPGTEQLPIGVVPKLKIVRVEEHPFEVLGQRITPVPLEHAHFRVLGFRIEDLAYLTDVSRIPESSWPLLEGVRILILDALRKRPHPAHFSLDQAIAVAQQLGAERTYLTHIGHELEHEATSRELPAGIELAYDGLQILF